MEQPESRTATAVVAAAGELLIRAAARLGNLSAAEQARLNVASEGKLIDGLTWAIQAAVEVAPELRSSLKRHPPQGFIGKF